MLWTLDNIKHHWCSTIQYIDNCVVRRPAIQEQASYVAIGGHGNFFKGVDILGNKIFLIAFLDISPNIPKSFQKTQIYFNLFGWPRGFCHPFRPLCIVCPLVALYRHRFKFIWLFLPLIKNEYTGSELESFPLQFLTLFAIVRYRALYWNTWNIPN